MAIYPKCDRCGVELKQYGAILIGPPSPPLKNMVEKKHLCTQCYQIIVAEMEQRIGYTKAKHKG
jgi:hypothetical protein